jgi:hypothetical protein
VFERNYVPKLAIFLPLFLTTFLHAFVAKTWFKNGATFHVRRCTVLVALCSKLQLPPALALRARRNGSAAMAGHGPPLARDGLAIVRFRIDRKIARKHACTPLAPRPKPVAGPAGGGNTWLPSFPIGKATGTAKKSHSRSNNVPVFPIFRLLWIKSP